VPVAASRQVPSAWEYPCLGFDFGSGGVRVARLVRKVRGAGWEMRLARSESHVGSWVVARCHACGNILGRV
jgi:hypothetical protein